MALMVSVPEHVFSDFSLLQTIHFYTIQTFLDSALGHGYQSLDENDVVVDRPLRPASSGMPWRFKTSLGEVMAHGMDTALVLMTMIQQAVQSDCTLQ